QVENSANDCIAVIGCRTESPNFAKFIRQPSTLTSCNQTSSTPGIFVQSQRDSVCIDSCISIAGQVKLGNGGSVRHSQFGRDDWCDSSTVAYCTKVTSGKTTVGSGTGTPIVYEFGYFKAGFFTPIGSPSRGVTALTDAAIVSTDAAVGPLFTLML